MVNIYRHGWYHKQKHPRTPIPLMKSKCKNLCHGYMSDNKTYDTNPTHDITSLLIDKMGYSYLPNKVVLGFFIWGFHGLMGQLPSSMSNDDGHHVFWQNHLGCCAGVGEELLTYAYSTTGCTMSIKWCMTHCRSSSFVHVRVPQGGHWRKS